MAMEEAAEAEIATRAAALEEAQERLRQSEELYRHVVELSSLIPWTADREGRILAVGWRWTDWTGVSVREALDAGWGRFCHPDDIDRVLKAWQATVASGRRYDEEWRVRGRDGAYRWCRARATKRDGEADDGVVWYGTVEDVHDRRVATEAYHRTQEELEHMSRLSAMGAMATAIAHDLNQPLTAIANYVRGSKRLLDQVEGKGKAELADALIDADRNTVRAAEIVRRVRDFVSQGTIDARTEPIVDLVEESCRFALADASARGLACRTEFGANCLVLADRIQIRQVLVNLIRNAIQAMEGRPRRALSISTQELPSGYCEVAVRDTGPGIPAALGPHIFDPLCTTRSNGMGVGLSICRMIVEAHGGTIWYETPPDGGAAILFTLPIAPALVDDDAT